MNKKNILIVSGCDPNQEKEFGWFAFKNIKEYAEKNKYDYKIYTGDDFYFTLGMGLMTHEMQTDKQKNQSLSFNWNKVSLVANNLYDYDYILWIDADAFIMDHTKRIEDVFNLNCNSNKHFFLAPDAVSPNVGVFLIKNSDEMHTLLRQWIQLGYESDKYYNKDFLTGKLICNFEQAAWVGLYNKNWNNLMVQTQYMEPQIINSHLQREFWRAPHSDFLQYKKGLSFILHLAGIPNKLRKQIIQEKIKKEIIKC